MCVAFGWQTAASAETRTLKLYFIHTKERAEITFKRNGRYDAEGLKKINRFLRDWRRNEPTKMDPRLLDLVWEAYRATGANDYIHVVSAYRSPATNGMLRSRSKGVAKKSQHMLGKAMDFYIPGVSLRKLREAGLKMQGGGVGYYPTSGSPFVHFDVGNVRHWPKMSRKELVAVFPNGKTLHVPSDGKPLPGFEQALAAYQSRKGSGNAGVALASGGSGGSRSGGILAALFGGGADEEEESGGSVEVAAVEAAPPTRRAASNAAGGGIRVLSPDQARRTEVPAESAPVGVSAGAPVAEDPETIIAALPQRNVPLPGFAPRPKADVGGGPLVDLASDANKPLVDLGNAPAAEAPAEVALGIPLPTWRPSDAPVEAVTQTALLALAGADEGGAAARTANVPMPGIRPADGEVTVASLAAGEAYPELPSDGPFPTSPGELLASPTAPRVASVGTPLEAMSAGGGDAASVLGTVKTTRKAARPKGTDSKPDPKPLVVAAQPNAARWALEGDYIQKNLKATKAPSAAYNIVRTAPREVYTAGFQGGDDQTNANRFTGKAVKFLSVARFN